MVFTENGLSLWGTKILQKALANMPDDIKPPEIIIKKNQPAQPSK